MNKKNIQARLRFKDDKGNDYPDWGEKKLGEVGEIVSGLTYSPDDVVDDGGVLVLRSSNINERRLAFDNNVFVNTDKYNPVKENDILICVRNGSKNLIGKNALIKKENKGLAFGAFMTVYRSPYNRFLFHWFDTEEYKKKVAANLGATINSINGSDLKKFRVPFPSVEEQEKIANFLCSLDDKIESLEKELEELKAYKKGVMQAIFAFDADADKDQRSKIKDQVSAASYKNSKDGILNNYEFIRFKDENGNDYQEWAEKTLGEVAVFLKGKNISKADIEEGGRFECIRYGELYTDYNEVIKVIRSKTNLKEENLVFSRYNDVIIPSSGETQIDIAKASCVLKDNVALGGDLNIIRSDVNGIYLSYFLNNVRRTDIAKLAQGNAVVHLYVNQLKTLKISIPIKEEQDKIATFLMNIDEKIDNRCNQIENTRQYKQALLQQLFN